MPLKTAPEADSTTIVCAHIQRSIERAPNAEVCNNISRHHVLKPNILLLNISKALLNIESSVDSIRLNWLVIARKDRKASSIASWVSNGAWKRFPSSISRSIKSHERICVCAFALPAKSYHPRTDPHSRCEPDPQSPSFSWQLKRQRKRSCYRTYIIQQPTS